jgi:hypothetical protein
MKRERKIYYLNGPRIKLSAFKEKDFLLKMWMTYFSKLVAQSLKYDEII